MLNERDGITSSRCNFSFSFYYASVKTGFQNRGKNRQVYNTFAAKHIWLYNSPITVIMDVQFQVVKERMQIDLETFM